MPNPTDHLRDLDRASLTLALPYGRHVAQGHLVMSVNAGSADPNHQIKMRVAVSEGDVEEMEGVWYDGVQITSANYTLYAGDQASDPASPFADDFPHVKTAILQATLPVGTADADVKSNPPTLLEFIGKFLKIKDYDSSGVSSAESYSASPSRVVADLIHERAGESTDRTNWTRWTAWRDFLAAHELVDYTSETGAFSGLGLRAKYYSDTAFTTLVTERIEPQVFFEASSGSPGLDVPTDNFSGRFEGKIRAKTTGSYTFTVQHNDHVSLWVNDLVTPLINNQPTGTHSATIALTADQFYDIRLDWKEATGDAECILNWTPPSETSHIIPQEFLYPLAVTQPRYEAHALFENPTTPESAVRQILSMSNSFMQQADGKRNFYCVEELTPVMDLTEAHIRNGSLKWYSRDRREVRNHWEAIYRDLESQYLETADPPATVEFPELQDAVGGVLNGQAIDLDNMTHWQAYKCLKHLAKLNTEMDMFAEFDGLGSTYKILPGDLITITHSQPTWESKQFLVLESTDYSPETTPDRRSFLCIEWITDDAPDLTTLTAGANTLTGNGSTLTT